MCMVDGRIHSAIKGIPAHLFQLFVWRSNILSCRKFPGKCLWTYYRIWIYGNRWHPVRNPDGDLPRPTSQDNIPNDRFAWCHYAWKAASIGYTFRSSQKLLLPKLKSLALSLNGSNLFLLKYYIGWIRKEYKRHFLYSSRIDNGSYPANRTAHFTAELKFPNNHETDCNIYRCARHFALCISSCSKFLEEKPESFTPAANFYQIEAQAQAAVNACYIKPTISIQYQPALYNRIYHRHRFHRNGSGVDETIIGINPANPGLVPQYGRLLIMALWP